MINDLIFLAAGFIMIAAIHSDITEKKIKNSYILFGYLFLMVTGIITGNYLFVIDIFIIITALFPLFLIKAVGAGDIKLLSVIGGMYGSVFAFKTGFIALITAAFFGVMGLIIRKITDKKDSDKDDSDVKTIDKPRSVKNRHTEIIMAPFIMIGFLMMFVLTAKYKELCLCKEVIGI